MAEHATQAIIGWGTQVQRGNGDGDPDTGVGETYANITEVTAGQPPQDVADEHEVSHFESPNRRKEYIQGMIDSGEATCTINYNPGVHEIHDTLVEDFEAGTLRWWRFVLPGGVETISFRAFIKGFTRNLGPNDPLTADVTWRVGAVNTERPAFT
jgi:hypothetical protein